MRLEGTINVIGEILRYCFEVGRDFFVMNT